MKILYITTSLLRNESASIRNISLINGIVENGNEVDILTLDFLEKFEDKFLKTFLTKETKIYKVKIPKFNKIFSIISNKRKEKNKNFKFILNWRIIAFNIVLVYAIAQHESAIGIRMYPPL